MQHNSNLVENTKVVVVQEPIDMTGAAATTEYIRVRYPHKIAWVVQTGSFSSTSNQAVTINVANSASGTISKAITSASASTTLTLDHYWKRSSADTMTKTSVSSSTFNITKSSGSTTFVIEIDTQKVGQFTHSSTVYDTKYVALTIGSPGAHAALYSIIALAGPLRYQEDSPPTVLS